jgi:hypothetical protein
MTYKNKQLQNHLRARKFKKWLRQNSIDIIGLGLGGMLVGIIIGAVIAQYI